MVKQSLEKTICHRQLDPSSTLRQLPVIRPRKGWILSGEGHSWIADSAASGSAVLKTEIKQSLYDEQWNPRPLLSLSSQNASS